MTLLVIEINLLVPSLHLKNAPQAVGWLLNSAILFRTVELTIWVFRSTAHCGLDPDLLIYEWAPSRSSDLAGATTSRRGGGDFLPFPLFLCTPPPYPGPPLAVLWKISHPLEQIFGGQKGAAQKEGISCLLLRVAAFQMQSSWANRFQVNVILNRAGLTIVLSTVRLGKMRCKFQLSSEVY